MFSSDVLFNLFLVISMYWILSLAAWASVRYYIVKAQVSRENLLEYLSSASWVHKIWTIQISLDFGGYGNWIINNAEEIRKDTLLSRIYTRLLFSIWGWVGAFAWIRRVVVFEHRHIDDILTMLVIMFMAYSSWTFGRGLRLNPNSRTTD